MPASDRSDSESLPSLDQLQEALLLRNLEQLHELRKELDFSASKNGLVTTLMASPPDFYSLKLMLDNYGPKCLSCRNSDGNTLVHLTAKTCESTKSMETILEKLGSLDCFKGNEEDNNTAVHFAAENRNNAALKWLAKKLGSDCLKVPNWKCSEAVHIAAKHQGVDSMKFIKTELGAERFEQAGELLRTAFHFAATSVRGSEVLGWLITEIGPEPLKVKDINDDTPVHLAARFQDERSMQLLKEALGDHMFSIKGDKGQTVVHAAARNTINNSALVWCVNELGAECLKTRDSEDRTPLHLAAQYQSDLSIEMALRLLPDKSLEDLLVKTLDNENRTVVHYAAMNKQNNSALRWIVQKLGTDCLTKRDSNFRMPIHLVGWNQNVASLSFIRDCLGNEAFYLGGTDARIIAHYVSKNKVGDLMQNWIVDEIGPQCMLVPDATGWIAATRIIGPRSVSFSEE